MCRRKDSGGCWSASSSTDGGEAGEKLEQAMDKIRSAAVSYGYDPEVAKAWLQDKSATWKELQETKLGQRATQAKAEVAEAADVVKGKIDIAVAEWKAERVERRAEKVERRVEFNEALDAKVAGLKARVDAHAKAAIDKLDGWVNEKKK